MLKNQRKSKRKLPDGMYELHIKGRKEPLLVNLQAIPVVITETFVRKVKTKAETKFIRVNVPDETEGLIKFFICCSKLTSYTSIGAENVHHAANKATKLFGSNWTSLTTRDSLVPNGYQHYSVAEFTELIRTL